MMEKIKRRRYSAGDKEIPDMVMRDTKEEELSLGENRLRSQGRLLRHRPKQAEEDKVPGEERLRQLTDMLPAGLEPIPAMKILAGYLETLETTFTEYRKVIGLERRQLESDCRSLSKNNNDQKQELERLTSDLLELTNTLEEQESLLSTANQKVANYEKQFKRLHRENSELSNKLTQKENDSIFYRQELDRCVQENEAGTSGLAAANARIDELERRLAAERENTLSHEKEARRLGLTLSESQNKNAITERKMEEMVGKYNEEIKRLSDRSNADAHHEVALLRKRVRSSVAPEMREFQQLLAARLSLESASNFKALMVRLISKMEQAGLDLK
jgi:chromosome segregation ATPase